jgi:hypothetical protein
MSNDALSSGFSSPGPFASPNDNVLVRFPPGLGLIPPRDIPHHPRNRGLRPAGAVA